MRLRAAAGSGAWGLSIPIPLDRHQIGPAKGLRRWRMRQVIPTTPSDRDSPRLIERPNGFYWQSKDGTRESGPFPTLLAAAQDTESLDDYTLEPVETLREAQAEIGIADWVDPETGEPAEQDGAHIEEH